MNKFPDIKTAIKLWQESLNGIISWEQEKWIKTYIFHSTGIANAAELIASKCNLDTKIAYICGLLHDYGKLQNEKITGKTHFMVGYDKMMQEGWNGVARICLTHSFPIKDFNFKDYISYSETDLKQAKILLANITYNDYDKLIQICDMLFEGCSIVSYQTRLSHIRERYNLTPEQTFYLEQGAKNNKAYFDAKCDCDIYKLLGIRE